MATISTVAGWNCSYSHNYLAAQFREDPDRPRLLFHDIVNYLACSVQKSPEPPLKAPNLKIFSGGGPPDPVDLRILINLTNNQCAPTPLKEHVCSCVNLQYISNGTYPIAKVMLRKQGSQTV